MNQSPEHPPEVGTPVGSYHIQTWGCQMNVHDSEKLAGALEMNAYVRAARIEDADVVLLNTCSIREKAAEKVFGELGRIRLLKLDRPEMLIGVCGCVAQQEGEAIFRRAPFVDFVIGPRATAALPGIVDRLRREGPKRNPAIDTEYRTDSIRFPFDKIRREGMGTGKAFVTLIEGCNHRCTYCIVPTTRGREICRDSDDVLAEVRHLAGAGIREIEFLGQTVNAYRDERGRMLGDLLLASRKVEGVERLRFTTSHPAQMTDRLMDAMAAARPQLSPYLHLPVQSGSSAVLKSMRRGYDREGYLEKIEGLRRRMPEILFGTDIIVGFPTETEGDFRETMTLLETVQYDTVYSFTYSPRPGTRSLVHGDPIPQHVKLERLQELQEMQKGIQERRAQNWVGRDVDVLVEGPSKREGRWTGRTAENRIVHFEEQSAPGRIERIRITRATAFSLRGRRLTRQDRRENIGAA